MAWITLGFAVIGFLMVSAAELPTEFSQATKSTYQTTEDAINYNNSTLPDVSSQQPDDGNHTSEENTSSSSNIGSSESSSSSGHPLASVEANTTSHVEDGKEYVESHTEKGIHLSNHDVEASTDNSKPENETEKQPFESEASAVNASSETSSLRPNVESDSEMMEEPGAMDKAANTDEMQVNSTEAVTSGVEYAKATSSKSIEKRSVNQNPSDAISTIVSKESDTETTLRYSSSEPADVNTADRENENTATNHAIEANDSSAGEVTSDNEPSTTSGVASDLVSSTETKSTSGNSPSSATQGHPRANRNRRVNTLPTGKVQVEPSPTSSIMYEDPDSVIDEPSSLDFPEHISTSDTEIWPESFPHHSDWKESSSRMTSSMSTSNGNGIPPSEASNHGASDSQDTLIAQPSEDSKRELEDIKDVPRESDLDHGPRAENISHKNLNYMGPISSSLMNMHSEIAPVSTEEQGDKETEYVETVKELEANLKDISSKAISTTTSNESFSKPEVAMTNQSPGESAVTTVNSHVEDNTEDSSINGSQIISVLHAALRQGILLDPIQSRSDNFHNESDLEVKESATKDSEISTTYDAESKIPNEKADALATPEVSNSSTMAAVNEAMMDQISDSKSSTSVLAPTTATSIGDVSSHKLDDIMLGDSPHDNHSSNSSPMADSDSSVQTASSNVSASGELDVSHTRIVSSTTRSVIRPVKIKVVSDTVTRPAEEESPIGDVSSNKIAMPQSTLAASVVEANNLSVPQTLSPIFQAKSTTSSKDTESTEVYENKTETTSEGNVSLTEALLPSEQKNTSIDIEDVIANKTEPTSTEAENVTTVTSPSPLPPIPTRSTGRSRILKPRLRNMGSNTDSTRPPPKSIIPTHRPRATTVGEPVSIFSKKKARIASITSSTTQKPTTHRSVDRIHYANRVPEGAIPYGPGISIDISSLAPTTEEPTTTEEPYSEEPFTDITQVPTVSSEDDVTLVKMAGTLVVQKGIRWNDQLYHRKSKQYLKIAEQMHVSMERLFRTSSIATRVWSIQIDGFSETYPLSGSVIVDFIVSLIKSEDGNDETKLVAIFNDKLKNNTFGRYTVDPSLTEFKILEEERRNKPTEAPQPEPPIPQWAIAVIVIGVASMIFIILFAAVTMYGRHHMRRRYSNKLSEEDIDKSGDWESKMAAAYENLAADTIYDADDGSIASMKRSYLVD